MQKILEIHPMDNGSWGVVIDKDAICTDTDYIIMEGSIRPIIPQKKGMTLTSLAQGVWHKVIATYNKRLEGLPLIVLPENDIDVEKVFDAEFNSIGYSTNFDSDFGNGYERGYKAALQENKKYTEEDIQGFRDILTEGALTNMSCSSAIVEFDRYFKSLHKIPKQVKVEYETKTQRVRRLHNLMSDALSQDRITYVPVTTSTPGGEIIKALEVYYE